MFFFANKKEPKNYHFFCQKKWTKKQLRAEFENWLVKTMNISKAKYSKFKGIKLPLLKLEKPKKWHNPIKIELSNTNEVVFVSFYKKKPPFLVLFSR